MARGTWRATASLTGATTALFTLGVALPAPAHAAVRCETVRVTVANSQGLSGGTVQATVCKPSSGHAYFDDGYYNYVQDHQADGAAARAYVVDANGRYGPLAVDDTSTSSGEPISWESHGSGSGTVRVYVCLGKNYPWDSGSRCASDSMS